MLKDEMMNKWLKIVQHLGGLCLPLPCHCVMCLRPSKRDFALCLSCETLLPWLKNPCPYCALPLNSKTKDCHDCILKSPLFDRLEALFDYAYPLNDFMIRYKYHEKLYFSKILGKLMAQHLKFTFPLDCIVAMPLHPLKQRKRGFNQTIELAKIISNEINVPLDKWSCTKIINTPSQSSLSARKRKTNISPKIFEVNKSFSAKHVLVIEDVVTTGVTVNAFTQALKAAKVETVEIWACCRTDFPK